MLYPLKFPDIQHTKINLMKIYLTPVSRKDTFTGNDPQLCDKFQTNSLPTKLGRFVTLGQLVEQHNKQLMLYQQKFHYFQHTRINLMKIYLTPFSRKDTFTGNDPQLCDKFQTNSLPTMLGWFIKLGELVEQHNKQLNVVSTKISLLPTYQNTFD